MSVYFDLWENFYSSKTDHFSKIKINDYNNYVRYEKIDKRYFSLLSVILEKGDYNYPKINENISFLTWNYDLQLESAFETFLPNKSNPINDIIEKINQKSLNKLIHLNGFRGNFVNDSEIYETVEKNHLENLEDYLKRLSENFTQFKYTDYSNSIKYSWELDSKTEENAKKTMSETNILVIIGCSFPAFNRNFDSELIKEFVNGKGYKKVYYQDPYGNEELLKLLFSNHENLKFINNSDQFHIPHEFLYVADEEEIYI